MVDTPSPAPAPGAAISHVASGASCRRAGDAAARDLTRTPHYGRRAARKDEYARPSSLPTCCIIVGSDAIACVRGAPPDGPRHRSCGGARRRGTAAEPLSPGQRDVSDQPHYKTAEPDAFLEVCSAERTHYKSHEYLALVTSQLN